MKKADEQKKEENQKTLENKWGKDTVNIGWTGVPNILIERQQALGLKPLEVNILLILLRYWWDASTPPYPSKRTIGDMVDKDESTIRKCMAGLEKKGFIQREKQFLSLGGQSSNKYVMDGLVERLQKEARDFSAVKTKRKENDARYRRGAPFISEQEQQ